MNEGLVRRFLALEDHPLLARVEARHVEALVQGYLAWPGAYRPAHDAREAPEAAEGMVLLRFLGDTLADLTARVARLEAIQARYLARDLPALHPRERGDLVLDFARELGATDADLRGDRRALRRDFDLDAVLDRCAEHRAGHEQRLAIILRRVGPLAAWLLRQEDALADPSRVWQGMDLEQRLDQVIFHPGDPRVRLEGLRALLAAISALPGHLHAGCLSDRTVRFIYRAAIGREEPLWIQREALSFLPEIDPASLPRALDLRLREPGPGEDLFLRCRAVRVLGDHFSTVAGALELLSLAVADPSPRVRQAAADAAARAWDTGGRELLEALLLQDPVPAVRAAALLALRPVLASLRAAGAQDLLARVLDAEASPFVLRTAFHVLEGLADALSVGPDGHGLQELLQRFLPPLEALHEGHVNLAVRRWAAQAREHLWHTGDPERQVLLRRIQDLATTLPEGESCPAPELEAIPEPLLGRALAAAARRDFGLALLRKDGRLHLARGNRMGFRLWRFLHEFRSPDPAKRQGYSHLLGRFLRGTLRAPSTLLGEVAETKVPGEPRFLSSEAGWRPYLPLLDDAVSLLDPGGERQADFYTAEGITELLRPEGVRRWRARIVLALGFAGLARLRNWQECDPTDPRAYLRSLEDLGFTCRHRPYGPGEGLPTRSDGAVLRFFPALAAPPVWSEQLRNLQDYFFSAYGNTLTDLLLFTLTVSGLFFGRNLVRHHRLRHHRKRIPLVIGGWGTRGKSGTERLKAALFSGLGYGVVSKTTGCESMFLYGKPFQELKEMFLFRPYDKVSIQEQTFVVRMASRLSADVFLWECMALSPGLVDLLQDQWMRDDLSTLTNAFPDHEDIQGPAGHDIPRVMTHFIPEGRTLYTAEEQMLPILAEAARTKGTRIRRATWLDSGLLTDEVMARFSYQEHPDNVALVLAMAEELGVDPDFALKEMADRTVADLGVLRTFPEAVIDGRRLRFTNGMSANEPFGALGNWQRVGFATHDPDAAPGEWITAVVNNRADRVARSQVFAKLIAEHLPADRYFLIGGNLTGLQGYLQEAIRQVVASYSLGEASRAQAADLVRQAAGRFRLCTQPEQVAARVSAMLTGLGGAAPADPSSLATAQGLAAAVRNTPLLSWLPDLERHRATWASQAEVLHTLLEKVRDEATPLAALDRPFRQALTQAFLAKLQPMDDFFAPGDKTISVIAGATPPGFLNRCMGIQNIKGTGLDFVYRFLAWERCHALCERLLDREALVARAALRELLTFEDFGLLSEVRVRETLSRCRELPAYQDPGAQDDLDELRSHLEAQMAAVREGISRSAEPSLKDRMLSLLENLLDTQDGLRRRWRASQVYRDLLSGRIARARAVEELRRLTKRQYGGWLRGKA